MPLESRSSRSSNVGGIPLGFLPGVGDVRRRGTRYGVVFDDTSVDTLSGLTLTSALRCIVLANIAIDLTKASCRSSGEPASEDKPFMVCSLALRLPGNPRA
jgi:hypothetical protein